MFRPTLIFAVAIAVVAGTVTGAGAGATRADAPSAAPAAATASDAAKALSAWLKLYRRGRIDYRSKRDIGRESVAARHGLRDDSTLGNPTWAGDLELICEKLATQNDAEAAHALAEAAAVGLDDETYEYAQAPYAVRDVALSAIASMHAKPAKEELAAGARGEWRGKHSDALRAAAVLGLGRIGDPAYFEVIQQALEADGEILRIQAASALISIGSKQALEAVIARIEHETADAVLVVAAKELREHYRKEVLRIRAKSNGEGDKAAPPATARLAVRAAIQALGRTTWRADIALVQLLDDFRSAEAVPALIEVLEAFRDNPADVERGKLSGLLKVRVHELLVSMTGAIFPADQPERWREFWDQQKDTLKVADNADGAPKASGTAAAGFAGIPIQGTRVVFILDLSGSMDWKMDDAGDKLRRLDFAKRELLKAIDSLSPNAMFNLVTFNGDAESVSWSKKLVDANTRNKKRLHQFVNKLEPRGGTNLWSGVEKALAIKSLVYGNHYETTSDEIFLLSDGAPTVGEVIDPVEILRLVSEINRFKEVRINTVFISSETPPEVRAREARLSLTPAELMRRLAGQNGGQFREV